MRNFRPLTFAIIIAMAAALLPPLASQARGRPDWVDGASSKYPSPRYFIGVGGVQLDKGGHRQQMEWAGDRARAEIAKTLRANVKVETRAERTVEGTKQGSRARTTGVSKQTDVVSTSAREVLEGVEIKEYYRDKKDRMLYALAVLDRVKAAKRLEQQITKTKSDLLAELDEAGRLSKDERLLPAIGHYQKALALSGEASTLEELMGVLKPAGYRMDPEITGRATNIRKLIWELRRRISFNVSVEGPASGVRSYLVQGLTGAGYAVGGKAKGPHAYDLKGITDLTYKGTINMGEGMDMQIYQADLDLEITDPASGETIGSLTWSASMNEKTAAMAEKNAVRALGRYVKDTVGDRLANLL